MLEGKTMDLILDIESTGLDANTSQLISIGLLEMDGGIDTIFFVDNPRNEKQVIENFFDFLSIRKGVRLITYYGSYFDVPFVVSRALTLGIDVKKYNIFPFRQIDMYDVVKRTLKLSKNSLGDVCKFLGIKKEFDIEGRDMPNIYLKAVSGDLELRKKIDDHLKDDLITLRKVLERLLPVIDLIRWEKE
jgi:uncharacterized protein YprB with RNaseH-like and TPR domain